jgi:hypothetical protein
MAGSIRELPQETRDQLRSTFIIQTLPSCIVELVQNSLDARAINIEIAFTLANWECRVTDNGTGIDAQSLKLLGKRYRKSKASETSVKNDWSTSRVHEEADRERFVFRYFEAHRRRPACSDGIWPQRRRCVTNVWPELTPSAENTCQRLLVSPTCHYWR